MPTEVIIETHIDAVIKQRAEAIFAEEGLTIDQVLRNMLVTAVERNSIPYGLFGPNAETREAMEEARRGGLKSFATVEELMADLNAPD